MTDPRCKCGKKATRLHARHDNGELENLCEDCYGNWHPPIVKRARFDMLKRQGMIQ